MTSKTYLALISRSRAGGENALLDVGRGQMIENGVIGHDQDAAVVLHWSSAIKDALAEEHGQRGRGRLGLGGGVCALNSIARGLCCRRGVGVFARRNIGVQVEEVVWDLVGVVLGRLTDEGGSRWWFGAGLCCSGRLGRGRACGQGLDGCDCCSWGRLERGLLRRRVLRDSNIGG